ncbi:MAG: hypothetical protein N4A46_07520 [Schleiferiaceae bacterium]|jgi:hypothetical protein|nr:hypothetical protein [Schleiferiaceae bacterium]
MKSKNLLVALTYLGFGLTTVFGQDSNAEAQKVVGKINTETPLEKGCTQQELSLDECVFMYSVECGGKAFVFSFNASDLKRVYKDKADFEDTFETLFFECEEGKNCVTCDSKDIPPLPVLPLKLPEGKASNLGEEAVKTFNSLIEECK